MKLVHYTILIVLLTCINCRTTTIVTKESRDFAHFNKNTQIYKAISSDDVRINIYKVESGSEENNVPELWVNEIVLTLKSKNYKVISTEKLQTKKGDPFSFVTFEIFYNGDTYYYSVSIFPNGKEIFVSEASGKKDLFLEKKPEIIDIIKSVEY